MLLRNCDGRLASLSRHVDNGGLLDREVFQHRFQRSFLPQTGLLDPAIGKVGLNNKVLVDLNEARLQSADTLHRRLQVARPNGCREAIDTVVRLLDRLVQARDALDGSNRTEDLLLDAAARFRQVGKNYWTNEVTLGQP